MLYDILGPKENESQILEYGKAFFIGAYFGIIYQWIQHECIESIEEVKSKLQECFAYAISQEQKK